MSRSLSRRRFLQLGAGALAAAATACGDGPSPTDRADEAGVPAPERLAYGDHDDAYGDLWLPSGMQAEAPVVVLVHGGFWRTGFGLDLMDGLAASVAEAGWAAWNIEYRRVGGGGGYPETFDDVAAAVDHLREVAPALDLERVAVVGHSAGGHLAAWAASRSSLPPGAPWADPKVRPLLAVAQAGVLDLVGCADAGLGGTACPDLVGGRPGAVPARYALTSPLLLLPVKTRVVAVHGTDDAIVPVAQSERYVAAAEASGTRAALRTIAGADHFDVIDPAHEAWQVVLDEATTSFAA